MDACWIAAAGVVIAEAAAALTAAILMYSAKADMWLAACSGAWQQLAPRAAAETTAARRGGRQQAMGARRAPSGALAGQSISEIFAS